MKGWKLPLGLMILSGSLVLSLTGCKKGPNDPFISLKSRDGRIKGTWKLTKVEYNRRTVITDPDEQCSPRISATAITSDDGTNFTRYDTITRFDLVNNTCVVEGQSTPFTGSFEFTVNKDGTYSFTSGAGTSRIEGEGYWFWSDSKKNKLFVSFDRSVPSCSLNGFDEDNASNIIFGQWMVERLASKELVLYVKCHSVITEGNRTTELTTIVRLTFEKQK